MVPRTGGYAYDVGVWDLSIIQGPLSVPNLHVTIRNSLISVGGSERPKHMAQMQLPGVQVLYADDNIASQRQVKHLRMTHFTDPVAIRIEFRGPSWNPY
jgi:hypothetical protein